MYEELVEELGKYSRRPFSFVMFAFPWGVAGTDLERFSGPEPWQREILLRLEKGLISTGQAVRLATTSGHGVGKSALVAWIILWSMTTYPNSMGVVTANTETQLKTKTWVQLAVWFQRFIARDLFQLTATALYSRDPSRERTWRFDMVPWSVHNTEAFAGLHNQGRRITLIMDEASAIPDLVWEVAEGALTDENTEIIWMVYGNPTRNKGRFRECFAGGRFAHRWSTIRVDSRTVSFTNKSQIEDWIKDYGEDSDFIRVRVKGEFPRTDAESFISFDLASEAVGRVIEPQVGFPLILGVDVGRFGDDPSVIYPRRGRDASSWKPRVFFGIDTMRLASEVAKAVNELRADAAMVDGGGVGGGVIDRCRQLRVPVWEVQFGAKADLYNEEEPYIKYANKRAEIWGAGRSWLKTGSIANVSIPTVSGTPITLVDELVGPMFGLNNREEIQLERKQDMRARGVPSPNIADALFCTFAFPAHFVSQNITVLDLTRNVEVPYDPFDKERIYA